MSVSQERCAQLRKLHASLIQEISVLQANAREEEHEGVANPLETRTIIKNLQETLLSIDLELQKCPPEGEA